MKNVNTDMVNALLNQCSSLLVESHETDYPILTNNDSFLSAINIFAHAMVIEMNYMCDNLDFTDEDKELMIQQFDKELHSLIKTYTDNEIQNIKQ